MICCDSCQNRQNTIYVSCCPIPRIFFFSSPNRSSNKRGSPPPCPPLLVRRLPHMAHRTSDRHGWTEERLLLHPFISTCIDVRLFDHFHFDPSLLPLKETLNPSHGIYAFSEYVKIAPVSYLTVTPSVSSIEISSENTLRSRIYPLSFLLLNTFLAIPHWLTGL